MVAPGDQPPVDRQAAVRVGGRDRVEPEPERNDPAVSDPEHNDRVLGEQVERVALAHRLAAAGGAAPCPP